MKKIKLICNKCGTEQQPDKGKSNKNWTYYTIGKKCKCGGRFEHKLVEEKQNKTNKDFKEELKVYNHLCKKGEERYIKCQEDRVIETFKEALSQREKERFKEGEINMAEGVLERIKKGEDLGHIGILCLAVAMKTKL